MKNLKQILARTLVLGTLAAGISGCELYPEEKSSSQKQAPAVPYYPTDIASNGDNLCSTNDAFFSQDYVGIANFPLYPNSPYDADWLAGNNGFQIFQGHAGGYGDTFEVVSKDSGIYMAWAYGDISDIVLFGNWKGKVHEGDIHLGDSIDKFLQAYPDSTRQNPNSRYPSSVFKQFVGGSKESWETAFQYATLTNDYDNSVSKGYIRLSADADRKGNINCIRLGYKWIN